MPRDVIPFRAGPNRTAAAPGARPNVAFAALDLFRRLTATLAPARKYRDAARSLERRSTRWGVPPLFFLTDAKMGERPPTRPNGIDDRFFEPAARICPTGAHAWAELNDLLDDAFTSCAADVDVRHAARAVTGLRERLTDLADDHRGCAELAALLNVADDCVVTVLHPTAGAGFRVRLTGIADLDQFHVLLADAVAGSPVRGYLSGPRPDARLVDAYLDEPTDSDINVATARFQLVKLEALRPDGTLPEGFAGTDHWLWGHESPDAIPTASGERILLIADAAYPRQWPVRRRFPALAGGLEMLNVLDRDAVAAWIDRLTERTEPRREKRAA